MSGQTDIMAWMQRAYVKSRPDPWYKKILLHVKLFHDRHFTRVEGTPGAGMIDELLDDYKSKRASIPESIEIGQSRAAIARMWDAI